MDGASEAILLAPGILMAVTLVAAVGSIYSYLLYPLLLRLVAGRSDADESGPVGPGGDPDATLPQVTLIVAAFNEAARIGEKLENSLALDYPDLEILVASDASDDGTDDLVRAVALEHPGRIRLVRSPARRGKEEAQRLAISEARGDILVFSDTGTRIETSAIRDLVTCFSDPRIGAVSSEDRFVSADGSVAGEGLYVRYEMAVRRLESRVAGLVGLSGSFFAARREVCAEWDTQAPSDFVTALNCARAGLRAVTAPHIHGYYHDLTDPSREYARKVRTILRGMAGLARHGDALSPARGAFAWQLWSHKVMRWATPFFLVLLLVSSSLLALHDARWLLLLAPQAAFWGAALATQVIPPLRQVGPLRIIHFFTLANLAIVHAAFSFVRGRRMATWQPSRRQVA